METNNAIQLGYSNEISLLEAINKGLVSNGKLIQFNMHAIGNLIIEYIWISDDNSKFNFTIKGNKIFLADFNVNCYKFDIDCNSIG